MNGSEKRVQIMEEIIGQIHDPPVDPFQFHSSMRVGEGKFIEFSREADKNLDIFSSYIMTDYFHSYKTKFTDSDWSKMTKRAFLSAFIHRGNEVYFEKDANETIEFIVKKLREWISEIQEREYVFGCYLFGNSDIESFSIGPVRFEPRNEWLARVHASGGLSRIAVSRIERTWKGEKLRERKPSEDETCERRALDTIGKCDFVCSVAVGALGSDAGLQKALQGAHLATTAIALGWNSPSWALTRIFVTYDRQPILHECLVLFPGRSMGWRTSASDRPPGSAWLEKKDWKQILSNFDSIFFCAEEIIEYVASGSDAGERPVMMNALSQALLWFHEGCRESVDTMAIVKFCSSMDALVCGKQEKGILNLIKSRLKVNDEIKLSKEVNEIYGAGRSRTVHGTNSKLGHDWSDIRNRAERMARLCLISCMKWASEHSEAKDPKLLSTTGT